MMLDKAEQDGGIVVANLGQKCLPEGRVVLVHTSSQACAAGCRWGTSGALVDMAGARALWH